MTQEDEERLSMIAEIIYLREKNKFNELMLVNSLLNNKEAEGCTNDNKSHIQHNSKCNE